MARATHKVTMTDTHVPNKKWGLRKTGISKQRGSDSIRCPQSKLSIHEKDSRVIHPAGKQMTLFGSPLLQRSDPLAAPL